MPVANLSNGQTRRTRIAKALLNKPEVLLLDDPFMGLDPAAVRHISSILEHMALRSSPRVIFSFRPQDPIPDWITHIMVLGNHNRILLQAPKEEAKRVFEIWRRRAEYEKPLSRADEWTRRTDQETQKQLKGGYLTRQMLRDMRISHQKPRVNNQYEPPVYRASGGEPIIEMDGVRVQYGDKCVLGHWRQNVSGEAKEGLHWTVRRGQRWAILGANGSGKTTLISLITSDHPQTYALPIRLFGRSRLPEAGQPGLSIFELQSRIGHSSPEIHAFFPRQLTIRQAIESAFSDTFLTRPRLTHEQDLDVNAFLRFFAPELNPDGHHGPPTKVTMPDNQLFPPLVKETLKTDFYNPDDGVEYADTIIFGDLSTALQRLVLLLRALVSRPDIVILDEALSGMPASLRDKCLTFIDQGEWCVKHRVHIQTADNARFRGLSDNQALLTIAHSNEDIPSSVRYFMRLPSGSERKEKLDFRFGVLKPESQWDNLRVWNRNWSLLYWKKDRERVEKNFFDADMPVRDDAEKYEWWHI
ncbi:P-loop containing nucleoside triphosphate hydrolase protein [Aspergillus heteromorphus CBS 117.55]|uniref:P-loop containing nucleoside triphosphate hydrolase protein n=1 Tax=Aspergillus heteromorphus CBS 117.55 TaxID=1448321 RepID=A0A317V2N9_9EURO|nr:P-loop containing nucleoside triphosphate hydrolase protein [Aspergillus heteromorphus CBS 117.55]PWY66460.1 P-loop containing nucleoside triphosphate hydrolase protein [Aspergillus heteromorphus CBS 117.55]